MMLANNVLFDDRINPKSEITDLKYPIIVNYLGNVKSRLLNQIDNFDVKQLASNLRIAGGPPEYYKPINVGLLFFNDHPERFFPYTQIEVVNIPDPTGKGMEERIFTGPIDEQLRSAPSYIKNNVIAEKVFKVAGEAEAIRIKNYCYEAIEEFLANAVYHKSYQIHEPIIVRIEADKLEITSIPGPDKSISDEDIKQFNMRTRRYRNRRIGDFLKELHLIEGRNTGIPTAIKAIKGNGSPLPTFLTDEDRTFFSVILQIHKAFINNEDSENSVVIEAKSSIKRKTREEIDELILSTLTNTNMSANELYRNLGYSGNASKIFRECIARLLDKGEIAYFTNNMRAPTNVLVRK